MTHCDACPFAGCPTCPAPGGDPQGVLISAGGSGYASGPGSGVRETMDPTTETAPAGNRGLTTTTDTESNDGCF